LRVGRGDRDRGVDRQVAAVRLAGRAELPQLDQELVRIVRDLEVVDVERRLLGSPDADILADAGLGQIRLMVCVVARPSQVACQTNLYSRLQYLHGPGGSGAM